MFIRILIYAGQIESIEPTPLLLALLETADSLDGPWYWEGNRLYRVSDTGGPGDDTP